MASSVCRPPFITCPNTVNPPFCPFRFSLLSFRLKKNSSVALFGLPPTFAIAIVPRVLDTPGSLLTAGSLGMAGNVVAVSVPAGSKLNPPPWRTKPGASRWKMDPLKSCWAFPLLT